MYIANLQQSEHGAILQVPQELLAELHLHVGEAVALETVGDGLLVRAHASARFNLADMLAECDFSLPVSDEEREWINAPALGRELL